MWGTPSSHRECEAPRPQRSAVGEAGILGRARVKILESSTLYTDVSLANAFSSCLPCVFWTCRPSRVHLANVFSVCLTFSAASGVLMNSF